MLIERAARCVGREHELAELLTRLEATRVRGADAVLVLGDPGLGKTALLRGLADRATNEAAGPVLTARAAAWESAVPGALLRQLLQEDPQPDPTTSADRLIARIRATETGATETGATETSATELPAPALVLVDDGDAADEFSVQALASALRRHTAVPLLVVVTATTSTRCLDEVAGDVVRIEGLPAEAVAELAVLRGRVLHPAMVDVLTRHTAGSPRDALALLDELPPSVWTLPGSRLPAPAHVAAAVDLALGTCGPQGRALVEALAVLDTGAVGVALGTAAQLAGLDEPLAALDEALRAGLVAPRPEHQPRLRDGLTAAAVLGLMGVRRAAEAHRQAADVVDQPTRRLGHLVAATLLPDPVLAQQVEDAARERGSEGAWAEAAALFRDASRLTADPLERDERLIRSVDALVAAGDCVAAGALVPAVESLRETPLRNAVLAYLAIVRGRAAEAEVRLRRAWDIVNAERDPDGAALIAQRRVLHSLALCRGEDLVQWADRAVAIAGRDTTVGVEAAAIRGLGLAIGGRMPEAISAYDDAATLVRHGAQAQRVSMGRGWLSVLGDDPDDARSRLEAVTSTGRLGGSARISLWALGWLARVRFLTGEWDQALQAVDRGRALTADTGIVLATPLLEWTATQVHVLRGDWAAAAEAARAAESVAQGYQIMQVPTLLARAQIAEAGSDYTAVRRILEPLTRAVSGTALQEPSFWPWADVLGNALVLDGRPSEADAFLRPHEERARAQGHRSSRARLGYARGRLLGATGDVAGAVRVFDEALGLLEGLPLRYDTARVTFAYGQTLRRAGRRRDADALLTDARGLWASIGARTYVERCDRELKAGGVRVARGVRGPEELTPQEEAVAEMVASGLSNREVAARLFVSPKTVQYHLTRIYAKRGVRSRTELAARHSGGAAAPEAGLG